MTRNWCKTDFRTTFAPLFSQLIARNQQLGFHSKQACTTCTCADAMSISALPGFKTNAELNLRQRPEAQVRRRPLSL
jgi:hypothetical protein